MILSKFKDRYNIIILLFSVLFLIIYFRLASIMLVRGEQYREEAENRIFKSIPLSSPRGEIRDRFGRLIAGNRPSFTVQMMKNETVNEKLNDVILKVIRILEKNQDKYIDEFPIIFTEDGEYAFTYDLEIENWKKRHDLENIKDAKTAFEILRTRYNIEAEDPVQVQQELIKIPELNVPISIRTWKFTEEMKKEQWLESHGLKDFTISAYDAFQHVRNRFNIPKEHSDQEARKIMVVRELLRRQGYLQYRPVIIARDISPVSVTQIEENIFELPGVNIEVEPIRYYPEGQLAAHVLGTLGRISQQHEIDRFIKKLNYLPSDIIGKTGVEHKFEETLRGENGSLKVIVDSRGRLVEILERTEPVPGDTLYLTIDMNLQRKTEQVLEEVIKTLQQGGVYSTRWGNDNLRGRKGPMRNATSASVVVTDVETGEILALANYPAYDPNLFATGISMSDWQSLMPENERDPLAPRPLANIALSTAIQPGSTFKMIVGLAALEQGLSPDYKILDRGFIQIGGHSFGNWLWNQERRTMGYQGLHQAIADSNNFYFYSLANGFDYGIGKPLPIKMNMDILKDYTKKFGLNDRTGIEIDVPRERSGGVPSIENKTSTIKALLRNHLRRQIKPEDLDETKVEATPQKVLEIVDEIVGWTEENPPRSVLRNRMIDLGIKPEKANIYVDVVKYTYFNQARWSVADTMNFAIGQGEHSYTPLQMANFMAIIANGGYRYNLNVARKIRSFNGELIEKFYPELVEKIELNNHKNLEEIRYGMLQVTKNGTAKGYFRNFPVDVAGKTGTAQKSGKIPPLNEVEYLRKHFRSFGVTEAAVEQKMLELKKENKTDTRYLDEGFAMREAIKRLNPRIGNRELDQFKEDYENYAWFTGFAPYDNPQIAISVLIFQGGSGGYAAPIFREIAAEYLGLNNTEDESRFMLENRLSR